MAIHNRQKRQRFIKHTFAIAAALAILLNLTGPAFSVASKSTNSSDLHLISLNVARLVLNGDYRAAIDAGSPYMSDIQSIESSDINNMMGLLNGMSYAYVKTGQYEKAERAATLLLKLFDRNSTRISDASILSNVSDTFSGIGKFNQALKLLERRLAIEKEVFGPNSRKIGYVLWDIGNVQEKQKHYAEAENTYLRALSVMTKDSEPIEYSSALLAEKLADLYKKMNKQEKYNYYMRFASEIRLNYNKMNPD